MGLRYGIKKAFTLLELMIVITIMAILTMALVFSFNNATLKAKFDNEKTKITNIVAQARSKSFSNILLESGEVAEYYLLTIDTTKSTLTAVNETTSEIIDTFDYETGIFITDKIEVYYFPPYGEVCFDIDCVSTEESISTRLTDNNSVYMSTISIYQGSGRLNLE